mmetsp:Transcript_134186/g.261332  ORF Transcript_134186/g.261332 Transcript_134186/m.261332 type:complete len:109 (+) Transcript_134186:115-441(+)
MSSAGREVGTLICDCSELHWRPLCWEAGMGDVAKGLHQTVCISMTDGNLWHSTCHIRAFSCGSNAVCHRFPAMLTHSPSLCIDAMVKQRRPNFDLWLARWCEPPAFVQ